MKTMRGKAGWVAALAISWLGFSSAAHADILFIDGNDQAVERQAAIDLARQYGETLHIVNSDGDELEEIFRKAQAGEIKLTTVVASGHSGGTSFFGKNGSIQSIPDLVAKYPKAQAQVRHFIGLGCYTGTMYNATEWQTRFPNATVLAGFNGAAPSGHWSARFLRQAYSTIANARRDAGGNDALSRKLGNASEIAQLKRVLSGLDSVRITVATFTICEQFYNPKGKSRESIEHDYDTGKYIFEGYLQATYGDFTDVPKDPHAPSQLRTFYNSIQDYLGIAPADQRAELLAKKEQAIRLIYFNNVKKSWSRAHAAELAAANRGLGAAGPIPDGAALDGMTRQQVLERITKLEEVSATLEGPNAAAAKALVTSMRTQLGNLDVPFNWID